MSHRPATDGILSAAFRWASAVGQRATRLYRGETIAEEAAMEHLVQAGFVRQDEPGKYYLDEAAVKGWLSGRR